MALSPLCRLKGHQHSVVIMRNVEECNVTDFFYKFLSLLPYSKMEVVRFNHFQTTQLKVSHRPPTGHPSSICKYINTCLRITFAFGTKNWKRNSKQYELVIARNQLKTVPTIMKNTMKRGKGFWGACGVTRARELGDHARESAVTVDIGGIMNICSYYLSCMPRVKSSYHIKLYKLWFFFQGEAVVQFLSIRSHFRGYLTIVGWVKCIWFLCVQLLFSLGQKPHSLFAAHGCGHAIANLSPCCCKLTSKPENGVQWVVSSNRSYANQLVKSDCFKIKSFKSLHKVDTKRRE